MKITTILKAMIVSASMAFTYAASATQYELNFSGNFVKNASFSESFGISTPSEPVSFKIVIDDAAGGTSIVPAGTIVSGAELRFEQDITLIEDASVVSADIVIGDQSWSKADLTQYNLGTTGLKYKILLDGTLSAENISQAKLRVADSDGYVDVSVFNCSPVCNIVNIVNTRDLTNGSLGNINGMNLVVSSLTVSTVDKIKALQEAVEAAGVGEAILDAVAAKYEAKGGDNPAAKNKLEAFINQIDAQRGKKLTDAQADKLIADAQDIIDEL